VSDNGSETTTTAVAAGGKVKVATVWLDGCSGCHMSFLDIDERLIELAGRVDLVYSPLVDNKVFPDMVDVSIVEGAVATDEDIVKIRKIRAHSRVLIALGDCAVTSNVPGMRNAFGAEPAVRRAYFENADLQRQNPTVRLPTLLERVRPVHEVVPVDVFVPGCPPPADAIWRVLTDLLDGKAPPVSQVTRFGA
jgi:NAD-reducing hydrogenase small subunit